MSGPGRGRGESANVEVVDRADPRVERDRQKQIEAARLTGMPETEIPVRGRGGFRQAELRTVTPGLGTKVKNFQNVRLIDVMANFVVLKPMKDRVIMMYRVDFEPEIESARLRNHVFNTAASMAFNKSPIFDGAHECRSGENLPLARTETNYVLPENGTSYKVTFTKTGTAAWGSETLRVYNMHMKTFLRKMGFYQPQPGLYVNPNHVTPVGPEIMMLRGFCTSANVHEDGRMLMNLNAGHKLVQRRNVLEIMSEIRGRAGGNLREAVKTELIGKLVVTSYVKRVYRIEDVDFELKPTSTFPDRRANKEVSYVDYYRTKHGIEIKDKNQPLLCVVINSNRRREEASEDNTQLRLIPELCNIAGLTEAQRTDNRLKLDLIRASQISPNDRVEHMRRFLNDLQNNREIQDQLASWGYSYETEPVKIKAFQMQPTGICTGHGTEGHFKPAQSETADFNVTSLAVAPKIPRLAILVPRLHPAARQETLNKLRQGFERVGLKADAIKVFDMENDSPATYINYIRQLPSECTAAIVVMQGQNKERYDSIKKSASVERGLITQVVTSRLLTDPKKSGGASTKIAIQIAAKVGGEPWWVDLPLKGSMICGYDTHHDTTRRGRSYGAFLASMNDHYSRWYSKADSHDRLDEISSQIAVNIADAMRKWREINKDYPEKVIIYRDGVGEGQLEHVFRIELETIRMAVEQVNSDSKLTMVVVNKRIGARFYMRANTGFANPPPGTVVDHDVTRAERFDFYLVSQSTRHGTITPTYYNIIYDTNGLRPEIHQRMAYKLCQLYYNWSGSVRVPAPCQYAHKLAFLCGEHLHAQPNASMDDKLHFL